MSMRYEHYDTDDTYEEAAEPAPSDREISLGTATVLGIFLALALVCALFFGFGYSMGRRSVPSALANVNTGISAPLPENRPAPGSLTPEAGSTARLANRTLGDSVGDNAPAVSDAASGAKAPAGQKTKPAASTTVATEDTPGGSPTDAQRQQVVRAVEQASAQTVRPAKPLAPVEDAAPAPPPASTAAPSYVQVAAISVTHKEDAEMLMSSLRRRGYAVAIRGGTQDQLLHVQIGPLPSKKEAEAMRQRLLADGYNAIVK